MATYYWFCLSIALTFACLAQCSASRYYTNYPFIDEDVSSATTAAASTPTPEGGGQKVWCVAKPAADDVYLRRNIDFACGPGGVDCRAILPGGACFLPNTPIAHASYAMNIYYQKNGRNWWTCLFNNTGLVVSTDPSFNDCKYLAQWST